MAKFNEQMPVYLQIMQMIKADIVKGDLKCGDKLPSVREMSEKLMVNPNTMQRVFMELEREGIVYSQRGKGTFVSEEPGLIEDLRKTLGQKYSLRYLSEMQSLGLKKYQVIELINKLTEDEK